jgi:hypothetical protein
MEYINKKLSPTEKLNPYGNPHGKITNKRSKLCIEVHRSNKREKSL